MPDKPIKPATPKAATSKAATGPRSKSKAVQAAPLGKTVRVGSELSLEELAREAGLLLVGPRATVGRKKIRKASGGAVLIKERDLLTLLHANAPARTQSPHDAAKIDDATSRQPPPVVSKRETQLLGQINAGLTAPKAQRLELLNARREKETLRPEEHAELLTLIDECEQLAVSRAEALVELAGLRELTVLSLMRALGLEYSERG